MGLYLQPAPAFLERAVQLLGAQQCGRTASRLSWSRRTKVLVLLWGSGGVEGWLEDPRSPGPL